MNTASPWLTGLDQLTLDRFPQLKGKRLGLLCHAASVNRELIHAVDLLDSRGFRITHLFGPQHGLTTHTQDNMVEWEGSGSGKRSVFSLYGSTRQPTEAMLRPLDLMLVDLQDVGARYYTYAWTLFLTLEACVRRGIPLWVLDRPNPIAPLKPAGPLLDLQYRSFVGMAAIPVVHTLTLGELALWLARDQGWEEFLHVVPVMNYEPDLFFDEGDLPWIMPSPNLPTLDSALVYPGMCLWEGTNLSEGRGTTRPFELCGAPFLDQNLIESMLSPEDLPGCSLRRVTFEPTFQKWAGQPCLGWQIHVQNRQTFSPVRTAVALLRAIATVHPESFAWKSPPYEYEQHHWPIDILAGGPSLRQVVEGKRSLKEAWAAWQKEADHWKTMARDIELYERP